MAGAGALGEAADLLGGMAGAEAEPDRERAAGDQGGVLLDRLWVAQRREIAVFDQLDRPAGGADLHVDRQAHMGDKTTRAAEAGGEAWVLLFLPESDDVVLALARDAKLGSYATTTLLSTLLIKPTSRARALAIVEALPSPHAPEYAYRLDAMLREAEPLLEALQLPERVAPEGPVDLGGDERVARVEDPAGEPVAQRLQGGDHCDVMGLRFEVLDVPGLLPFASFEDLREHARFCRVSNATVIENHPHDIVITKESPNYMPGKRE